MSFFSDRRAAGRRLAIDLSHYTGRRDVVVLALPRGGVPVAFEVAMFLGVPLEVFVVRKLGVPGQEELAMGAIAHGGVRFVDDAIVRELEIPEHLVEAVAAQEQRELERREKTYRAGRPMADLRHKVAILIDDGLATGASMQVAIGALRRHEPARIVVAVPVAPPETCEWFRQQVDEVVCSITPEPFQAVGLWYDDFTQTTDDDVQKLLALASHPAQLTTAG